MVSTDPTLNMTFDELLGKWSPKQAAEWKRLRAGSSGSVWARERTGDAYMERGFPYLLTRTA